MNDQTTESAIQFSDADKEHLEAMGIDPAAPYHTVLESWREVLRPARAEATQKVGAAWAGRVISAYPHVTYADLGDYRDRYFAKIVELLEILELEIDADADCLSYTTPTEDAEENAAHYKNMLLLWQLAIQQWEVDWDYSDPAAAVEIAAIAEVHKMFLSEMGLVNFLNNINFEFGEHDQQLVADALHEAREAAGE